VNNDIAHQFAAEIGKLREEIKKASAQSTQAKQKALQATRDMKAVENRASNVYEKMVEAMKRDGEWKERIEGMV
jgi:uncharacterized coiled-coil DUF342 family protein